MVEVKLANETKVIRNCQDVVSTQYNNKNSCKSDILDLPLYGEIDSTPLELSESNFELPLSFNDHHVAHGKEVQFDIAPNNDDEGNELPVYG